MERARRVDAAHRLAHGRPAPIRVLKAGLGVGQPKAELLRADPDLWLPRLKAVVARVVLWAFLDAAALALPVTSLVYWITGVQTP